MTYLDRGTGLLPAVAGLPHPEDRRGSLILTVTRYTINVHQLSTQRLPTVNLHEGSSKSPTLRQPLPTTHTFSAERVLFCSMEHVLLRSQPRRKKGQMLKRVRNAGISCPVPDSGHYGGHDDAHQRVDPIWTIISTANHRAPLCPSERLIG